ncbi:hypothetical protein KsCSTR_24440 [Candidatus Kuenenia stuttgartiensis]|uniref:Uncharacterized protein n=1 Tax=Kuenenia stuttgartiensis TaxID=174633 RepID=Q1Q3Y1_KUEST|nr:hypothetical protein KsCSTR_24440 [Candidatus Kuenenia stuttgartiensis]CAJ74714.1 unknown protein [Candidatus Kuenenia stuttgartiensis]
MRRGFPFILNKQLVKNTCNQTIIYKKEHVLFHFGGIILLRDDIVKLNYAVLYFQCFTDYHE